MKLTHWPYQLIPRGALNARTGTAGRAGSLVRVSDGMHVGYADLHPFPEFGDADLDSQWSAYRAGNSSPLLRRSLELAERDLRARREGRSLLAGPEIANNVLASLSTGPAEWRAWADQGVRTLKIKCGRAAGREQSFLRELVRFGAFRLRLDFNSSLASVEAALDWLRSVPGLGPSLDYVEDPCAYDVAGWRQLRGECRVALDHEVARLSADERPEADVFIEKPVRPRAVFGVEDAFRLGLDVTVTSMMDHPVGVLHALSFAEEWRQRFADRVGDAGCLTLSVYEADAFSRELREDGPFLRGTAGTGIGFDERLASLSWRTP